MKINRISISGSPLEEINEIEVFKLLTSSKNRAKFYQYGNFGTRKKRIVALKMGTIGNWGSPSKHTGFFIPQENSVYIADHDKKTLQKLTTDDYQIWHRDADCCVFEDFKFEGDPLELIRLFIGNDYQIA